MATNETEPKAEPKPENTSSTVIINGETKNTTELVAELQLYQNKANTLEAQVKELSEVKSQFEQAQEALNSYKEFTAKSFEELLAKESDTFKKYIPVDSYKDNPLAGIQKISEFKQVIETVKSDFVEEKDKPNPAPNAKDNKSGNEGDKVGAFDPNDRQSIFQYFSNLTGSKH